MNLANLCHITKEKVWISTKTAASKLVPDPIVFAKNQTQPLLKMKILKQATYIRYVVAKLLKFLQISMQTS